VAGIEDEILVVLSKEREHKAGYFDELKQTLLDVVGDRLRREHVDPQTHDPRSGRSLGETLAIGEMARAAGVGRTLARSWWNCTRSPEPRHRWFLIENLHVPQAQKQRLHRDSGVLRRGELLLVGPEPLDEIGLEAGGDFDFWASMSSVVRKAHEQHNFTTDPVLRDAARLQALQAANALLGLRLTPVTPAMVEAQADAAIRQWELYNTPREREERRAAAADAIVKARLVEQLTGDPTKLVEALRVSALVSRDSMPIVARRKFDELMTYKSRATLSDAWWAVSELDRLGIDLAAEGHEWTEQTAGFVRSLRVLEERLTALRMRWAGLRSRQLVARALTLIGQHALAESELLDALHDYREAEDVGQYHLDLVRRALAAVQREAR
jgi:hypothetical protein